MSKQKATKLQSFFEGYRRKASLQQWSHLRTKAGESRLKFQIQLPLLNETVKGMNGAINEAFIVMQKDESKIERTNLNVELEGMTLEIFATAESKRRSGMSTGVKMQKLALVASGEGEKRELDLHITVYIPANVTLRDWAWDHLHREFYMEAVYSQSEMDFGDGETEEGESEEGEESGEEEEEEAESEVPAAKPKKSGPKELAAFHQQEVDAEQKGKKRAPLN